MPYFVGSPIDAYCTKCQKDTDHVVTEADGLMVRAVRCHVCGVQEPFHACRVRKRAVAKAEPPKTTKRKTTTRRKKTDPGELFAKAVFGRDRTDARTYKASMELASGDLIEHPRFGLGVVVELTAPQKAKVLFRDEERVLVCNRG